MSETFDPYHKWLGIPPKDQPPNHYRLLAIDVFEADPDVIDSAADQRMSHVRAFQTGRRAALSQQILNEIAAARICLLSAEKKAVYDEALHNQLAASVPPNAPPIQQVPAAKAGLVDSYEDPEAFESDGSSAFPADAEPTAFGLSSLKDLLARRKRQSLAVFRAFAVIVLLFVLIAVVVFRSGVFDRVVRVGPQPQPSPVPNAVTPPVDQPKPETTADQPNQEDQQDKTSTQPPISPSTAKPKPDQPPAVEPDGPTEPVPVPDSEAQQQAQERLRETLTDAPAAKLLKAALSGDYDAAERFVLLMKARDAAVAAADTASAVKALEELASRYTIDLLAMRADTWIDLGESARSPDQFRTVAENSLTLCEEAIAAGNRDLGKELATSALVAARKAGDNELAKRATLRVVELQEKQ